MAVIKVGAATEVELKEKKHRIEDAVSDHQGGGRGGCRRPAAAWPCCGRRPRSSTLAKTARGRRGHRRPHGRPALEEPLKQIAVNAGLEGGVVVEKVRSLKGADGLNAATGEYEDLVKAGVIDAAKVTRSALQNAASIAALFLTTEAVIADKPEKDGGAAGRHARRRHGRHGRHGLLDPAHRTHNGAPRTERPSASPVPCRGGGRGDVFDLGG